MPTKIELKPCPFCGRKPKTDLLHLHLCQIHCEYSKCDVHPSAIKRTEEEAVQAWNTRASGWIPFRERMPEPETQVMVYGENNEGDPVCEIDWIGNVTRDWQYWNGILTVTHWMPLPESPKGESE